MGVERGSICICLQSCSSGRQPLFFMLDPVLVPTLVAHIHSFLWVKEAKSLISLKILI